MAKGPAPQRDDKRRRRNAPVIPTDHAPAEVAPPDDAEQPAADGQAPSRYMVEPPDENPMWHPLALQWYRAVVAAGQAVYYVSSDWAMAVVMADLMTRDYEGPDKTLRTSTQNTLLKVAASLLLTEGDRRRARIELERAKQAGAKVPDPAPGAVTDLGAWRALSTG